MLAMTTLRAKVRDGCAVLKTFALAIAASLCVSGVQAHEFWLEPSSFAPKTGASVAVEHRNGQKFNGNTYPYLTDWFESFQLHDGDGSRDVQGTDGDDPAAKLTFRKPGTVILSYVSKPDSLSFATWEKFTSYLKTEGLDGVVARHRKRGLPETGFSEKYVRNAKTLINVDGQATTDRALGLAFELVIETPLDALATSDEVTVRLLHHGKPHAGKTIKVFAKSDGANPKRVVTNDDGRASIKVVRGEVYLLNAVVMEVPKPEIKAEWFSHWASTTFKVPG